MDHVPDHNIDENINCKYCGYCNSENLQDHIEGHRKLLLEMNLITICEKCSLEFLKESDYTEHWTDVHKNEFHECSKCNKQFKKLQYLKSHSKAHVEKKNKSKMEFRCPICAKLFHRKFNLETHLSNHVNDLPCHICCLSFSTDIALQRHITENHEEEEIKNYKLFNTKVKCTNCKKTFLSHFLLFKHFETIHLSKIANFKCEQCHKGFKNELALKKHMVKHNADFICEICKRKFANAKTLAEHGSLHLGLKPFKCEHCDLTFRCKSNRHQHMDSKHLKERKYKCNHCPMAFFRSNTLKDHILVHLKDRPHACDVCDKSFNQRSTLIKHKNRVHPVCLLCNNKVFDNKKLFESHNDLIHLGQTSNT